MSAKSGGGSSHGRINVTKTFLPPYEEYEKHLKAIWERSWLTNQGPCLREFEEKVTAFLDVPYFQFVSNGTSALQLALRAHDVTEGEVITTPFSYVATTSSILWERCKPVFVDIDPHTFCMDADKIEAAITEHTKAIMPVHVFGNACDVEKIGAIAKKHGIKVIYDAAHAFGVKYKGKSLLSFGDMSALSFHATKLLHTVEGGGLVTPHEHTHRQTDLLKRFGHDEDNHISLGINAKASEFHAAMGLANLPYINKIIASRKAATKLYDKLLGSSLQRQMISEDVEQNYSYYPVLFKDEATMLKARARLNKKDIHPRRYFYPSLNTLPYLNERSDCPVSEDISRRILCLPLFAGIQKHEINRICEVINP